MGIRPLHLVLAFCKTALSHSSLPRASLESEGEESEREADVMHESVFLNSLDGRRVAVVVNDIEVGHCADSL